MNEALPNVITRAELFAVSFCSRLAISRYRFFF
jgi:hypothetical protein